MDENQRMVYVFAQSVAAMAEIEAMKAQNTYREMRGETIAYGEEAFMHVIDQYELGTNTVMGFLQGV